MATLAVAEGLWTNLELHAVNHNKLQFRYYCGAAVAQFCPSVAQFLSRVQGSVAVHGAVAVTDNIKLPEESAIKIQQ